MLTRMKGSFLAVMEEEKGIHEYKKPECSTEKELAWIPFPSTGSSGLVGEPDVTHQ